MPVPTWRLAALAAALAPAVLVAPGDGRVALAAATVVWVAAGALDALRAPAPRRLQVHRHHPGVVALDGDATVTWELDNPTRRVTVARIADALPPSLGAASRRASVRVPAGGRARASTTIRPVRRGRFPLERVTVRTDGPWRLVSRQRDVTVATTLRVYPPFRSRDEAELRIRSARILEIGLRSAQGHGGGTEFEMLREYRVDDEFRRIDWAATARAGKPIVRTYRAERNQTVITLLDTGRVMAGRIRDPDAGQAAWADVPRLDHALDGVLLLTHLATRLGDRAGLVAFSDRVHAAVAPGHRRDQLGRVIEACYDLRPTLVESDYHRAFAETLARFPRRALLVVLTDLATEAAAETLVPALPLVLRSHLVLIAGVRDPAVDHWSRSAPVDATGAYRRAAAEAALAERTRLVHRLRGLGAVVVDEPPARLGARLGDAYLRAKATGRL